MEKYNIIKAFKSLTECEQDEILDELKLIREGVNDNTMYIVSRELADAWFVRYATWDYCSLYDFRKYHEKWLNLSTQIKSGECLHYDRKLNLSLKNGDFIIIYDTITSKKENLSQYTNYIINNMHIEEIFLDKKSLKEIIMQE
jgi:hypothetical protein